MKDNLSELVNSEDYDFDERTDVITYGIIPNVILRMLPKKTLENMYSKTMRQAVVEYGTDLMVGIALDFKDIEYSTLKIEKEIVRRGLKRQPLNPREQGQKVYATDIWGKSFIK